MFSKKITLNNGKEMPMLGLGTYKINTEKSVEDALRNALKCGYRHIDTALLYENEIFIGKALLKIFKEGLVKREELFITSKLWNTYHEDPERGIRTTLNNLQMDYIDLYLVHWPVKFKTNENFESLKNEKGEIILDEFECVKLWNKMEKLLEKGLTKSIGVANHGEHNLQLILKECKIKPVVNQVEINPYLSQEGLVDFCHKNGINVISYSSFGGPTKSKYNLREDEELIKISKKYNKTVSQVILSWLIKRDIMVIPKSTSEEHIKENAGIFDIEDEDMKKISGLNKNFRFNDASSYGPDRFK
ncbi:aldose reductase [Vairimorpha necatrix]|uniref:Aldose reductase n=1 Tax=Vairimorpha necatrix TaxID=6039 RepID=A0AAX4J9G1_9MICR